MIFRRETELAAHVVAWLREKHWRVYQEVDIPGGRVDILAEQQGRLWAIECKLGFGLDVIEQAARHRHGVTWSSAAVPYRGYGLGGTLCRSLGVGVLGVAVGGAVYEPIPARPNRRADCAAVIERLQPEHETFAEAGTAGSSYWSPFKATCREVLAYVQRHPGCTVKDLVNGITHHYSTPSSARAHLPHWIDEGLVPGVRIERDGRSITVHLARAV